MFPVYWWPHAAVPGISALANSNINFPGEWAKDSNLLLNEKKTNQMLITTQQIPRIHDLGNVIPSLNVNGQTLERVRTFKLLGTWRKENFKWTDHLKELVSSCHKVLSILRKIQNMAPRRVKKQLAKVSSFLSGTITALFVTLCLHTYRRKFNRVKMRLKLLWGTVTPPSKMSLI